MEAEQCRWLDAINELLALNQRDGVRAIKGTVNWLQPPHPRDTTPGHLRDWKEQQAERFDQWFREKYGPPDSDVAWRKWAEENHPKPKAKPALRIYDEEDDDDGGEAGQDEGFPFGAAQPQ